MKKMLLMLAMSSLMFACSKSDKEAKPAKMETKPLVKSQGETSSNITWYTTLEEAQKVAKESDKNIFIHFTGSDWCGWCIKLHKEVYDKPSFAKYAQENLVMVQFDYPQNIPQSEEVKAYNQDMLQKFGVQGFPTVLILSPDLKMIGRTGYQAGGPDSYVSHIKALIASATK